MPSKTQQNRQAKSELLVLAQASRPTAKHTREWVTVYVQAEDQYKEIVRKCDRIQEERAQRERSKQRSVLLKWMPSKRKRPQMSLPSTMWPYIFSIPLRESAKEVCDHLESELRKADLYHDVDQHVYAFKLYFEHLVSLSFQEVNYLADADTKKLSAAAPRITAQPDVNDHWRSPRDTLILPRIEDPLVVSRLHPVADVIIGTLDHIQEGLRFQQESQRYRDMTELPTIIVPVSGTSEQRDKASGAVGYVSSEAEIYAEQSSAEEHRAIELLHAMLESCGVLPLAVTPGMPFNERLMTIKSYQVTADPNKDQQVAEVEVAGYENIFGDLYRRAAVILYALSPS